MPRLMIPPMSTNVRLVLPDPDLPATRMCSLSLGLRSVKGIGEKTVDAIENDVLEWLAKNAREPEADED